MLKGLACKVLHHISLVKTGLNKVSQVNDFLVNDFCASVSRKEVQKLLYILNCSLICKVCVFVCKTEWVRDREGGTQDLQPIDAGKAQSKNFIKVS